MNIEEQFKKLASRAYAEMPPPVDVAGRVLTVLMANRQQQISEKPWIWLAAASSAVAVPIATAAIFSYYLWTEPLLEISQAIGWVTR